MRHPLGLRPVARTLLRDGFVVAVRNQLPRGTRIQINCRGGHGTLYVRARAQLKGIEPIQMSGPVIFLVTQEWAGLHLEIQRPAF